MVPACFPHRSALTFCHSPESLLPVRDLWIHAHTILQQIPVLLKMFHAEMLGMLSIAPYNVWTGLNLSSSVAAGYPGDDHYVSPAEVAPRCTAHFSQFAKEYCFSLQYEWKMMRKCKTSRGSDAFRSWKVEIIIILSLLLEKPNQWQLLWCSKSCCKLEPHSQVVKE